MKKTSILLSIVILLFACKNEKGNQVDQYFSKIEQDSLMLNIIKFIGQKPSEATFENRFDRKYTLSYQKELPNFQFENYFIDKDSTHYFFIIRPVGNLPFKRGVLGKFSMKKGLTPFDFEEIVNTPHLELKTVKERGNFLFQELIKTKNLDNYLSLKQYVEWPDEHLVYDKRITQWVEKVK